MKKTISNSFLIIGNTVGSGILALPLVTAIYGFAPSVGMLIFAWFVMSCSAKLLLESSYWVNDQEHLVSILSKTLSRPAKFAVSLLYACMMYGLLVAYISISADIIQSVAEKTFSYHLPYSAVVLLFTLIFGIVVFYKLDILDRYNRYLVGGLLIIFLLMVFTAFPHVSLENLNYMNFDGVGWTLPLAILCFGYPSIIPSLRQYCGEDKNRIVRVISIGGTVTLMMYIIWQFAVLGSLPLDGPDGIRALPAQNVSSLTAALHKVTQNAYLHIGITLFAFFAVATSFMSISKIVADFYTDGLFLSGLKNHRLSAQALTLVPPVLVSLFVPGLFIYAITFSGAIVGILLVFLPAYVVWRGRYNKKLSHTYVCEGGKPLLIFIMAVGLLVAITEIVHKAVF